MEQENIDFKQIEQKWQKRWEDDKVFNKDDSNKPKFYCLEMFPYPSGSGLHMGHAFNYTIGDIYSRFKRLKGFNVLYPMGYDSFGLPAENAAIKNNSHPREYTTKSINNFIKQQKALGISYDWNKMVITSTPEYYQWNQYFFLKFLEKGLVYRKKAPVNWCPECNTVLANEQVHDGKCWRHKDTNVEQKNLEQWFFKITKYADELLQDIEKLKDWPERIKIMQKNWIGKSKGVEIFFDVVDEDGDKIGKISTFTTRPDTVFGITYLVLAPEHPLVLELSKDTENEEKIKKFISKVRNQTTIERTAEGKEKNGIFLGKYFINPVNNKRLPLWTADYALYGYGTGAVMAVPAHDQRDFDFAKKYNLPIKIVIQPKNYKLDSQKMSRAFVDQGSLVNSKEFDDKNNIEAIQEIGKWMEDKGFGKRTTNYKLRDWLISRQRYWGTPIPIIYCKQCGAVPVPEKDLPVLLPENVKFGEIGNPLDSCEEFVNVKCPKCNNEARRETDTMDTFVDSSWYFFRYCDIGNKELPFSKVQAGHWLPVDQYIGGAEHACMHLIYARFFSKALRDLGMHGIDEPFTKLFNQGMLHGEDGHVMSKSRGNVINPLEMIDKYNSDTLRLFLISVASPDKDFAWSTTGIQSVFRFINKIMNYFETVKIGESSNKVESKLNKTIKGITEDIEEFKYNFAVIKLRHLFESLEPEVSKDTLEKFLLILNPFCPHITEELWEKIDNKPFISQQKWPEYDNSKIDELAESAEEMIIQISKDIIHIQDLAKIKQPKSIKLIIAKDWKYKLFKKMKQLLEKTHNPGEIMKSVMDTELKRYGLEIKKLVPKVVKDKSLIPLHMLTKETEIKTLQDNKEQLEKRFNCKFEIIKAEDANDKKANNSLPNKPAIVVE
tara:strand:- start:13794 stop:16463 length:2670 start_codon:yes stop_codon:yes gene_type:complete